MSESESSTSRTITRDHIMSLSREMLDMRNENNQLRTLIEQVVDAWSLDLQHALTEDWLYDAQKFLNPRRTMRVPPTAGSI